MEHSVRARFAAHLAITTLPLLVVAGTAIVAILLTVHALEVVSEEGTAETEPLRTLERHLHDAEREVHHYLIRGTGDDQQAFLAYAGEVDHELAYLEHAPFARTEEVAGIRAVRNAWDHAKTQATAIFALDHPVGNPQARTLLKELMGAIDTAEAALAVNYRVADEEVAAELSEAKTGRAHAFSLVLIVLGLGLGSVFITGRHLARTVLKPVADLEEATRRLTSGDLSYRVAMQRQDEFGRLARHFNTMADQIERDQHTLRELSMRDGLTGLLNHAEFLHRLQIGVHDAQRHHRSLALLLLDIDWFKQVNDRFGHLCGDDALRVVAQTLRGEVRPGDEVGRYGGEEFAIILRETDEKRVGETAERIRAMVAKARFEAGDEPHSVTISIGIALFPLDGNDGATLVAHADQALYQAKRAGRNRVRSFRRPVAK